MHGNCLYQCLCHCNIFQLGPVVPSSIYIYNIYVSYCTYIILLFGQGGGWLGFVLFFFFYLFLSFFFRIFFFRFTNSRWHNQCTVVSADWNWEISPVSGGNILLKCTVQFILLLPPFPNIASRRGFLFFPSTGNILDCSCGA